MSNPSLIPKGVTIALAVFTLLLTLAGYGFRRIAGDSWSQIIPHASVVVSFFMVVVPALFVAGAKFLNKFKGANIQTRNAITLGLLMSCVAVLSIMGRYS